MPVSYDQHIPGLGFTLGFPNDGTVIFRADVGDETVDSLGDLVGGSNQGPGVSFATLLSLSPSPSIYTPI